MTADVVALITGIGEINELRALRATTHCHRRLLIVVAGLNTLINDIIKLT